MSVPKDFAARQELLAGQQIRLDHVTDRDIYVYNLFSHIYISYRSVGCLLTLRTPVQHGLPEERVDVALLGDIAFPHLDQHLGHWQRIRGATTMPNPFCLETQCVHSSR